MAAPHRSSALICVALLVALLPACGNSSDVAQSPEAPATGAGSRASQAEGTILVIGSVSDDAKEEAEVFQPFVNALAEAMEPSGVTGGEVVVTGTAEEMAERLRAGEVDLYVDSMYGISKVVEAGAGVPLLRRWKDGSPTYRSVVVVRRDSGITSAEQLAGRTIGFEDPTSTDGYFLPAATLLEQGVSLSQGDRPSEPKLPGTTAYVFTDDDENTVFQVLEGRLDAGALSEEDLAENAGPRMAELVPLLHTVEVPRHVVVARPDLDPALTQALVEQLLRLHETERGQQVLEEFDDTARFDALSNAAFTPFLELSATLRRGTS